MDIIPTAELSGPTLEQRLVEDERLRDSLRRLVSEHTPTVEFTPWGFSNHQQRT